MKNKIFKTAFLSSGMLLIFACSPKKEETAAVVIDKEQVKKEIQARENEFAALYNSGELKNIGYYAEDAKVFSSNRAPIEGKESIIAYLKAGIDSSAKGNTIEFTTNDVFVSNDGNQVVEIGYYKLVDAANVNINSGDYMVLFEKRDGKYVSVREMSTSEVLAEQ